MPIGCSLFVRTVFTRLTYSPSICYFGCIDSENALSLSMPPRWAGTLALDGAVGLGRGGEMEWEDIEMSEARAAGEYLQDRFVSVRHPEFGFGEFDYLMVCHGCGKFHTQRSAFISTPMSIGFSFEDGTNLCVGAYGCADCMTAPGKPIRKAYYEGMTREAYNNAAVQIGAILRPARVVALCRARE